MPLNLVAVLDVGWEGEEEFAVVGGAYMEGPIHAASNEHRVFVGALDGDHFGLAGDGPGLAFADVPEGDFPIAAAQEQKLVVEFEPGDVEDGFLS